MKKNQKKKETNSSKDGKEKPKESSIKKNKEEEKGLEKKVEEETKEIKEENKKVEEEEFEEFIEPAPSVVTRAPVLERISRTQIPQEVQIPNQEERKENKKIDYSASSSSTNPANEPKYGFSVNDEREERKYQSNFVPLVLSRREGESIRQELLLPSDRTGNIGNSNMNPQFAGWDSFDDVKKLPFEIDEKKYRRFKFK